MKTRSRPVLLRLEKAPTGIRGLDEITGGGLPRGRSTLVCGDAGSGKTLLAMEFLVRGAVEHDEPGVFFAFEETGDDLTKNFASLGFDVDGLVARRRLVVEHIRVERSEIEEAGEYDLEGLFVRLGHAIDTIGARRVALDTLETLFAGLSRADILRAELRRLFGWLKDRGVTTIITAERGEGRLTRHGLEEYVSDCVIMLDHRVVAQSATRRLRVAKYRGSAHQTSEYPFIIDERGVSVLPITSLGLTHEPSQERVSSGVARLDAMLGGEGYYRGSSVLVTGSAGAGKTSFAAAFVAAACRRGEKALYFAFEESPGQLLRNARSIDLDLRPWVQKGRLRFQAERSTNHGLELHLANIHRAVEAFAPRVVVLDPISNLNAMGSEAEVRAMLTRAIDYLKGRDITLLATTLVHGGTTGLVDETSGVDVSSLMDTWLLLRNVEQGGERNRLLHVLKSRGMAHSNQVRELVLSDRGIDLTDVYVGPGGVLAGAARRQQAAEEREATLATQEALTSRQRRLEARRRAVEARIAALRAAFEAEEAEVGRLAAQERALDARRVGDRRALGGLRGVDAARQAPRRRNGAR